MNDTVVQTQDPNAPTEDTPAALSMVEVTNGLEFPIEDRFDGIPIIIPPGGKITLNPAQAMHCFGYPGEFADMARHMAKRYGWQGREYLKHNEKREPIYHEMAAKVVFEPIFYDLVPRRRGNDPIPADTGDDATDPAPQANRAPPDTGTKVGGRKKPLRLGGSAPKRIAKRSTAR